MAGSRGSGPFSPADRRICLRHGRPLDPAVWAPAGYRRRRSREVKRVSPPLKALKALKADMWSRATGDPLRQGWRPGRLPNTNSGNFWFPWGLCRCTEYYEFAAKPALRLNILPKVPLAIVSLCRGLCALNRCEAPREIMGFDPPGTEVSRIRAMASPSPEVMMPSPRPRRPPSSPPRCRRHSRSAAGRILPRVRDKAAGCVRGRAAAPPRVKPVG